jgi:hypothetical protein
MQPTLLDLNDALLIREKINQDAQKYRKLKDILVFKLYHQQKELNAREKEYYESLKIMNNKTKKKPRTKNKKSILDRQKPLMIWIKNIILIKIRDN